MRAIARKSALAQLQQEALELGAPLHQACLPELQTMLTEIVGATGIVEVTIDLKEISIGSKLAVSVEATSVIFQACLCSGQQQLTSCFLQR